MTRLTTSTTTWFLVQKVDLMPYFHRLDQIENALTNISMACIEINCTHVQIIKEMNVQINEAKENVERVIDLLKSREEASIQMKRGYGGHTRTKRGVLNFMGSLTRILFGVVDHKTEMELRGLIEINANDSQQISSLLANQTKVIFTEFGQLREEDNQLRNMINELNKTMTSEIMSNDIAKAITLLADNLIHHPRLVPPTQIEMTAK